MRYVVEFGVEATGLVPIFDTFVRLDTGAAVGPHPSFTEIGATGSFTFDKSFLSTDPDIYFQASVAGVQVPGRIGFSDSVSVDLGTMPADVAAIKVKTDNLPTNVGAMLDAITKQLTRALGLLHENSVLDQTTYESGSNNLLSGRIRLYDTSVNAINARNQSELNNEYDTGKLAQYAITGHYLGDNMVNYLTTKVWSAP